LQARERVTIQFEVDGRQVEADVDDPTVSLLDVLRDHLGERSPKDGCSPQGQCGCCTVLVDGAPRVACVTPARRCDGRRITTLEGWPADVRSTWADAFTAAGASQCGFCTPGIIVRLEGLRAKGTASTDTPAVERALAAHLCRCTGWRTIVDAYEAVADPAGAGPVSTSRDLAAAGRRASIEGGVAQRVDPEVALGRGGFADDTAPTDALVAVADGAGGWVVGETLADARRASRKVQGRRTTIDVRHPLEVPPGEWHRTLRTTWVEPAYLETDASWCAPGGEPASPLANGGAFGGKVDSVVGAAARELADRHGRSVRVLLSREDTVRVGPKRPPIAAGLRDDGTGIVRVVRTAGIADALRTGAPGLDVEEVDVVGLRTSSAVRAAGWAEAAVLMASVSDCPGRVRSPSGAEAEVVIDDDGVHVTVACGDALDEVALRSYCVGAVHMALGWVTSEAVAVDDEGAPHDLTIRSFGILRASEMPSVDVEIQSSTAEPVNGSDAVFAATAGAAWARQDFAGEWPTGQLIRAR
jgi:aerobic-type carbon monoxide dehydrogenase small subunit (CoxS/CutS family)